MLVFIYLSPDGNLGATQLSQPYISFSVCQQHSYFMSDEKKKNLTFISGTYSAPT